MSKHILYLFSCIGLFLGSLSFTYASDEIAIVVDSQVITMREWQGAYQQARAEVAHLPAAQRPNQEELITNVVNYLAINRLQSSLAEKMGFHVSDQEVNAAIQDIAARNKATVAQLREYLTHNGMSFDGYREEIRGQILMSQIQNEVVRSVRITEDELDVYMRSAEFAQIEAEMRKSKSPQVKVSHILIKITPRVNEAAARSHIERIRVRIENGESFADIAGGQSQDPVSAARGGDLGWSTKGQFAPEFEKAMLSLQPGVLSQPIKTAYGYHLIKVEERKSGGIADDKMLRNVAREFYFRKKASQAFSRWQERMLADVYIERRF